MFSLIIGIISLALFGFLAIKSVQLLSSGNNISEKITSHTVSSHMFLSIGFENFLIFIFAFIGIFLIFFAILKFYKYQTYNKYLKDDLVEYKKISKEIKKDKKIEIVFED